jgi:hypothetical protein
LHIFILLKKLIAILLLAIYLFNLAGYSLVFHYFIRQSEDKFAAQLDENKYRDAELVEISIPFNLPYTQNSSGFETLDGSVELNGVLYNYVKRRIYNDTLYIMCLSNQQRTQLIKEKSRYAGEANDFAASKKEKDSTAKKAGPSTEYNNTIAQYRFTLPGEAANRQNKNFAFFIPVAAIDTPEHPPQFTC